ncbi:MAG: hypothetical protein ACE5JM_16095, partial [Armatimonadota bacterium]
MTTCVALLLVLAAVPAFAMNEVIVPQQPEAVQKAPAPDMDMEQMMQQMGMSPKEAMMMKLLGQGNMDPMMMLMLMGAMGGRGMDGDALGPLMFMKMLSGATAAPTQPVVLLDDNTLIIVTSDHGNPLPRA